MKWTLLTWPVHPCCVIFWMISISYGSFVFRDVSLPYSNTHTVLMLQDSESVPAFVSVTCRSVCLSVCLCALQLRLTVAEAVGSMCHLMTCEKLEEQIPKLIPAILSLYKKNNEHYIISKVGLSRAGNCCRFSNAGDSCKQTVNSLFGWVHRVSVSSHLFIYLSSTQSLCQVLDASVNMGSRVLETQLDNLLIALHQQVHIMDIQTINPLINELIRIVDVLVCPKCESLPNHWVREYFSGVTADSVCVVFSAATPAACIILVFSKRAGPEPRREKNISNSASKRSYCIKDNHLFRMLHWLRCHIRKSQLSKGHTHRQNGVTTWVTHPWLRCSSCILCSTCTVLLSLYDFTVLWLSWVLAQCLYCCNILS